MGILDRLFPRDEVEQYHAEVAIGDAFRTWQESDMGRYILGRAEMEQLHILQQLAECDPKDTTKIIQLQANSKAPAMLLRWIEEAIFQGEQARFQLDEIVGE